MNSTHIYSDICSKSLIYRESRLGLVTEVQLQWNIWVSTLVCVHSDRALKQRTKKQCEKIQWQQEDDLQKEISPKKILSLRKGTKQTQQVKTQPDWIEHLNDMCTHE